ncbi:hypothetical protein GDO81_018485 [Engystomops pustulosus]|uniref:Uncharacterized protein n=1 Tax=Engystomops pustulosus TaxID=76066 RepID=A0AAV6ZXP7_ENGPU|nr:hypothetical protein GDO81_018485 [Engystomops pustulosus]
MHSFSTSVSSPIAKKPNGPISRGTSTSLVMSFLLFCSLCEKNFFKFILLNPLNRSISNSTLLNCSVKQKLNPFCNADTQFLSRVLFERLMTKTSFFSAGSVISSRLLASSFVFLFLRFLFLPPLLVRFLKGRFR